MSTLESNAIASATVELLEERLRRLTYLVTGEANWAGIPTLPEKPDSIDDTVSRRLIRLESELEKLSRNVPVVREVIEFRECFFFFFFYSRKGEGQEEREQGEEKKRKEKTKTKANIFHEDDNHPSLLSNTNPNPNTNPFPQDLTSQNIKSIILSYESTIQETITQLRSLKNQPIPETNKSSTLISLQPRINTIAQRQDEQTKAISELRIRTARVLQRWYEVGVIGGGECWAEWEGRLDDVEREVRRVEVGRERRRNEI